MLQGSLKISCKVSRDPLPGTSWLVFYLLFPIMNFDITPNVTVNNEHLYGWVQDVNFRGTFSILLSCLSTLFLCTWSVMHLNVPDRNQSARSYLKIQVLWCLIGIFGPELAIWSAWRQYISAKALRDQVRAELMKVGCKTNSAWAVLTRSSLVTITNTPAKHGPSPTDSMLLWEVLSLI